MLLLTLASYKDFHSPTENFLKGMVATQNKYGTTVSVAAACIMHELSIADELHSAGKIKEPWVAFKHIQDKYGLERYQVSRNALLLTKEGLSRYSGDKDDRSKKNWVELSSEKKPYKDSAVSDKPLRAMKLTDEGRRAAAILFADVKLPSTLPAIKK